MCQVSVEVIALRTLARRDTNAQTVHNLFTLPAPHHTTTQHITHPQRTPGEIRIQKDIAELDGGSVANVTFPSANTLTTFLVSVTPDTGYWSGCTYQFTFNIPPLYPHEPPKVHCDTQLYHPNVNEEGNVCLNILREDWKPVLDINAVIYGLIYLFYDPNPADPLNHKAAKLLRENKGEFERNVSRSLRGGYVDGVQYPALK